MSKDEKALDRIKRRNNNAQPKIRIGGYALVEKMSKLSNDKEANSSKWRDRYQDDILIVESLIAPNVYRLFNQRLGVFQDVVVDRIRPIQLRRPEAKEKNIEEITRSKPVDGKYHLFVKFKQNTPGILFMNQWIPEEDISKVAVAKYWTGERRVTR